MTVSVCNSVSYHSPPHLHSSEPKRFNWEGLDWLSELVIEIGTQCGYFNQHWLLYQGRNEPAHHGAAGHPSPEPQVDMEEWLLHWMWQSLRGANGLALTTDGYWDLCSPSKTIKFSLIHRRQDSGRYSPWDKRLLLLWMLPRGAKGPHLLSIVLKHTSFPFLSVFYLDPSTF